MVENLINDIEQAMLNTLDNEQLAQLHKVLDFAFRNESITVKEPENISKSNDKLIEIFLAAKQVEGCSPNSIAYYRSTIVNALRKVDKAVTHDDMRYHRTDRSPKHKYNNFARRTVHRKCRKLPAPPNLHPIIYLY